MGSPLKKMKKAVSFEVSFAEVEVRFYCRIVGDHPTCTVGPPVGIGWEYTPGEKFDLSDWDDLRERLRRPTGMRLNRQKREKILRDWGYCDKDLASAVRDVNRTKAHRRKTVHNLGAQKIEEKLEQAARKVKGLLFLGSV
jgi:hypothetical protein